MHPRRTETAMLVVNWRSAHDIVRLLERLNVEPPRPTSLIVLDNASGEQQVGEIRAWAASHGVEVGGRSSCLWPTAMKLIASDTNLGYARGVNEIVGALLDGQAPRRILLLNPDTSPSWAEIEELEKVADETRAAIVGARVISRDVVASEFAGERWPHILVAALPGIGRMSSGGGRRYWRSGRFDGAAALIDAHFAAERWQRLGYLIDPGLEMYWDEWDLSLDAARCGHRVVTAGIIVQHTQTALAISLIRRRLRAYYMARNPFLVARRWLPRPAYLALIAPMIANALALEVARAVLRRRRPPLGAALQGVADGLRGRTGRWRNHPAD